MRFIDLMRDQVFFTENITRHLRLDDAVRAMRALGHPVMLTRDLVDREVSTRLVAIVDTLNVTDNSHVHIPTMVRTFFNTLATDLVNPPTDTPFEIRHTLSCMGTHVMPGIRFGTSGAVFNPLFMIPVYGGIGIPFNTIPMGGATINDGIAMTHTRINFELSLRFENNSWVTDMSEVSGLCLMFDPVLPHAQNEFSDNDVYWTD